MRKHAAPIFAALLLLLPLLYVGSYLALVTPGGYTIDHGYAGTTWWPQCYRCKEAWCSRIFWPLEQIDRKLRPNAWMPALTSGSLEEN